MELDVSRDTGKHPLEVARVVGLKPGGDDLGTLPRSKRRGSGDLLGPSHADAQSESPSSDRVGPKSEPPAGSRLGLSYWRRGAGASEQATRKPLSLDSIRGVSGQAILRPL